MDQELFQALWQKLTPRELALLYIEMDNGHLDTEIFMDDVRDEAGEQGCNEIMILVNLIEKENN